MERLLTWFDRLLDFVTLGWWSRWQGNQRIALHRERGEQ
jgi:hypothetical protein